MSDARIIRIQEEPIEISELDVFLRAAHGGAVTLFCGTTRRVTEGRVTSELSYEAAESLALAEFDRLLSVAYESWPIIRAVLVHRVGVVPVGETSVVVGVATPHRAEAYDASRFLIDELKKTAPIWKKEIYEDGSTEWVRGVTPA